jgi:hypothetical protein
MPHDAATLSRLDAAASVLTDHHDPAVQAIGAWLAAGARGDLIRYLAAGSDDGLARLAVAVAERNRLLQAMAQSLGDLSIAEQARVLYQGLSRYRAAGWRIERDKAANPHQPSSTRAVFWDVLRLRDRHLSGRQIRKILSLRF